MNYRHHFHAGNFCDVFKHALLLALLRGLQQKEKGFLYLDTHAGAGRYDLAEAARGDTRERTPEHPDGIGRLWGHTGLPPLLADFTELVRRFNRGQVSSENANASQFSDMGGTPMPRGTGVPPVGLQKMETHPGNTARFYPGSPWIVRLLARAQDRLALCELHPEDGASLEREFAGLPRVRVHPMDGYTALKALLPPPERRALVLIDPPYESQEEGAQIIEGLDRALRRLPGGVFAIWYPLTDRARADEFHAQLRTLPLPPTLLAELAITGRSSTLKVRGCGLVVLNPPWQFADKIAPALPVLAELLQQEPGAEARIEWLVAER